MRPSAGKARAAAVGCAVLALLACLGVVRGAGLLDGASLKENVAQAFHAFELEVENANTNLLSGKHNSHTQLLPLSQPMC